MTKVFLGGTCNGSLWRDELIPMLGIEYYNPVVEDWTPECMAEEIEQRKLCDFCLYTVTPEMIGVYSVAEAIDDSNKRPEKTVLCVLGEYGGLEFSASQIKSLDQVCNMVASNGATFMHSLKGVAAYLGRL